MATLWNRIAGALEAVPTIPSTRTVIKGSVGINVTGPTNVYVPTTGKSIQLVYFGLSSGAGVSGTLASLNLTGYGGPTGDLIDQEYLIAAGQGFASALGARGVYVQGSVNGALTLTLSVAQQVYVNYEVIEV